MAMAYLFIWMEQNMKANGIVINNMVKDLKYGLMGQLLKAIINLGKNKVLFVFVCFIPSKLISKGEGIFSWENGNSYNGNFVDGMIEGYGTYKWYNGKIYTGDWKNNTMHGY